MNRLDKLRGLIFNKILPVTYENSMSYYELLCKVVKTLNDVIEIINIFEPQDLTEIFERLDAVEAVNEEQTHDINELLECCENVKASLQNMIERISTLEDRVDSVSNIVSIHTAELDDHEVRITELEKYQSQLLLKKNVANIQEGDFFNMQAEEFIARGIII